MYLCWIYESELADLYSSKSKENELISFQLIENTNIFHKLLLVYI